MSKATGRPEAGAPTVGVRRGRGIGWLLDAGFKYWALAPALLILALLTLYPAVQLIRMSFSEVGYARGHIAWSGAGLSNFRQILGDATAMVSFRNTIEFVAITVACETVLGLVLALAVSESRRLSGFYRTVLMLPVLIPPIGIGAMWLMMYDFNYGFIDQVLSALRLGPQPWLATTRLAFPSILVVDIWHWTSFLFLIILAGLESLPQDINEAAQIDGAGAFQRLWHITLPLLRPTIAVAAMLRTIFAFKIFDEIYLLTNGGPGDSTQVITPYIQQVFFIQGRMGYAAALAVVTALLITIFVLVYQRVDRALSGQA